MGIATFNFIYSLLILSSHFYHTNSFSLGTYGFQVHVINELSDSLTIHCASKDNNFDVKRLTLHEDYHWHFRRNIFLTTMFFCHFWWGSKSVSFEVFNYTISEDCRFDKLNVDHNQCVWVVKEDGFYFGNQFPPQNMKIVHHW